MTDEAKNKALGPNVAPVGGASAPSVVGKEGQPKTVEATLAESKPFSETAPASLETSAQIEQQPVINPTPPHPLAVATPAPSFEQQPPAQTQGTLPKVDLTYLPPGDSPNHPGTWERKIGGREEGKGTVELLAV
ncbi:MAG: hypothetical protein UU21_C0003G0027 [Candidatus Levybacteria bacterium GW2011_GWA2_40_8]|nr:MAG: hypothetical protein UU21_C0003G0027 [Candidatus Levybacteria bacterium GW2011_GWA2_40_8]